MSQPKTLLISTSKGLIVYHYENGKWTYGGDHFLGFSVSLVHVDAKDQSYWACLDHKHWGQKLHKSTDGGQTWTSVSVPKYPDGAEVKKGVPASLKLLWSFASCGTDQPETFYVGTEPGGLFKSKDGGASFQLVESLWNHPSRPEHWFGGGRNNAGIHSIVIDPRDSEHLYIGVSCAGVFESRDGGTTWAVRNKGLRADYLPDPYVEVGHDPHLLLACPINPDVLWQQNHCGVFRSTDAGLNWEDITDQNNAVRYGFTIAIDEKDTEQAWVIPAKSDGMRVAVDHALAVYHTADGGKNWKDLRNGLPQHAVYDIVLRHALSKKGKALIFGTTTGNVYVSQDLGENWSVLSHNLPKVNAVLLI